ncbi:(2Fe-2S)-binding protein [Glycomyces terrestris]|uniref:(2Fe-2S)-binding protein n=1 Tax=Glycomyces terrestris TaxID=2493553 RepID=A0A426UT90_9ACTN|nr:(2Fe-2S)-binding protein [Glycomyces terrestris]RRR96847.1 (2Fe-2S)-binding protein [Glycomyces terrestris]
MSGIVPWQTDPIRPDRPQSLHITVDGARVEGLQGQSIAGVLLTQDRTTWRTTVAGRPRGVFCGIGVCFDCIATVNGESDVRLCMRRAHDGDVVTTQDDTIQHDAHPQEGRSGPAHGPGFGSRLAVDSGPDRGPGPDPARNLSRDPGAGPEPGAAPDAAGAPERRGDGSESDAAQGCATRAPEAEAR